MRHIDQAVGRLTALDVLPTACYDAMERALKIAEDVICNAIPLIVAVKLAMMLTLCL